MGRGLFRVIGNTLEQEILGLYNVNVSSMYSINQIATLLKKKYPYINKKVTSLIENDIFKMTIVGRSHLCSLNLKNEETIHGLILNDIRRKKAELEKNISLRKTTEYIEKLSRNADIKVVLKSKNNILFVSENRENCEHISRGVLKQALHDYEAKFLTKEEFLRLIAEDKTLQQERIILYGFEKYYEHVREIEDELKLKYSKLMP